MLKTGGQLGRTQKAIIPESAARNETACTGEGILDQICERILSAGYLAREMANRLEYHTDIVRGGAPGDAIETLNGVDMPIAKLDRINEALSHLERSLGYLAEQTGRATTLI